MIAIMIVLILFLWLILYYIRGKNIAIRRRRLLKARFDAFMMDESVPLPPRLALTFMFRDCLESGFVKAIFTFYDEEREAGLMAVTSKEEEAEILLDPLFNEFFELARELIEINISLYWPLYILRSKRNKSRYKQKLQKKLESEWYASPRDRRLA